VVDERPLRELYLAAFEDAITEARAWLVMGSYNSINGTTASENQLLETPLSTEWGFDGVVISDWIGGRSVEAANAHQDLEMPGPVGHWGPKLLAAVEDGRLSRAASLEKVIRILRLAARVGSLDAVTPSVTELPAPLNAPAVAHEVAARGAVLVRNRDGMLPLNPDALQGLAVIGHNAEEQAEGGAAPALPFGYGLGYTTFELGAPHASQTVPAGKDVVVHVPVRNTGGRSGREVVQVYLERRDSAVERPAR
jgi:beta-glucosidase